MPVSAETPPAPSEEKIEIASFRRVLKNRNFLLLWLAQLVSLTVFNAANFDLIVLVNNVTHSPLMAGIGIITFTLPAIPFSLIAGAVVDRVNKHRVLWVSNILRLLLTLLMVIVLILDQTNLWPLFILTFMVALVGQFFTPAEGASIPLLVGERELMPALSLFNITQTLAMAFGYLILGRVGATAFPEFALQLGGLTVHVSSIASTFLLVAICYLISAGLIFVIPVKAFNEKHLRVRVEVALEREGAESGALTRASLVSLWEGMAAGWRIVRHDRLLFYAVIQLSVVGDLMLLIGQLAGPLVEQLMNRPAADMSIVMAPAGIGLVGMSILMPQVTGRVEKLRLAVIGLISLAVGFLLLLGSQWLALRLDPQHGAQSGFFLWITIGLMLLLGAAMAGVNVPTQTLMQERAPEEGRGRVLSLQFMLYNLGSIPILLFAGAFSQFVGLKPFIVLASLALLAFCWWGVRYTRQARRR